MILRTLLSLLIFLSANDANANYVINLTDENFEHTTQASTGQTTGKWFINFHSTSCGFCKKLEPTWDKLSEEIKLEHIDSGVLIASVNVKENPILAKRFDIKKLPTFLFFAEEGMFQYPPSRERHVDDFVKFVLNDSGDGSSIGGYQEVEKMNVPKGPQGLLKLVGDVRKQVHDIEFLRFLLDDVEHILVLRKNAAVLLIGFGIIIGFFLASLLALISRNKNINNAGKVERVKSKDKNE